MRFARSLDEICELPVQEIVDNPCHLYLWCPNALLPYGLQVLEQWGFTYKGNVVWYKVRKDGGPVGRLLRIKFRWCCNRGWTMPYFSVIWAMLVGKA